MYNKMFDGLADQLAQTLMDTLQPAKREQEAREFAANARSSGSSNTSGSDDGSLPGRFQTKPKVPMCYAESIASTVISKNNFALFFTIPFKFKESSLPINNVN